MLKLKNIKDLLILSLPIILGQVGMVLIGSGDVYVASQYSTNSVAAIGIANGILNPFMLLGIGLMAGISAFLAISKTSIKAKEERLKSLLTYSIILGVGSTLIALFMLNFVDYFGIEKVLVDEVKDYIKVVAWSFPFVTVFCAIKEYLQAYEEVIIPNIISIVSVFINVGLNYLLVFGYASFEGFGAIGLAYASLSIRILMALILFLYILKDKWGSFDISFLKDLFKFSFPISLIFFFEVLAFCYVNVISGNFGVETAAANNIIVMICSLSFMVPMSIGHATAVKVGYAFGKKNKQSITDYANASLLLVFLFALFSSFIYLVFPDWLMSLMSKDIKVIQIGTLLFLPIALFQIVDGFQVCLGGILRGLEETKITSKLIFGAYWIVGIPLGSLLAFNLANGFVYLWYGIVSALTIVAIGLFAQYRKILVKIPE